MTFKGLIKIDSLRNKGLVISILILILLGKFFFFSDVSFPDFIAEKVRFEQFVDNSNIHGEKIKNKVDEIYNYYGKIELYKKMTNENDFYQSIISKNQAYYELVDLMSLGEENELVDLKMLDRQTYFFTYLKDTKLSMFFNQNGAFIFYTIIYLLILYQGFVLLFCIESVRLLSLRTYHKTLVNNFPLNKLQYHGLCLTYAYVMNFLFPIGIFTLFLSGMDMLMNENYFIYPVFVQFSETIISLPFYFILIGYIVYSILIAFLVYITMGILHKMVKDDTLCSLMVYSSVFFAVYGLLIFFKINIFSFLWAY